MYFFRTICWNKDSLIIYIHYLRKFVWSNSILIIYIILFQDNRLLSLLQPYYARTFVGAMPTHPWCKKSNPLLFQDREFVELEVPYNGQPKRPGSPSPLISPTHSAGSRTGLLHSCCGRCCGQRYQVIQSYKETFNKICFMVIYWSLVIQI